MGGGGIGGGGNTIAAVPLLRNGTAADVAIGGGGGRFPHLLEGGGSCSGNGFVVPSFLGPPVAIVPEGTCGLATLLLLLIKWASSPAWDGAKPGICTVTFSWVTGTPQLPLSLPPPVSELNPRPDPPIIDPLLLNPPPLPLPPPRPRPLPLPLPLPPLPPKPPFRRPLGSFKAN